MTTRILRTLLCLLALATSASADSPWVLWLQVNVDGYVPPWTQMEAYESKKACDKARDGLWLASVESAKKDASKTVLHDGFIGLAKVPSESRMWQFTSLGRTGKTMLHTETLKCWPAGTTPR